MKRRRNWDPVVVIGAISGFLLSWSLIIMNAAGLISERLLRFELLLLSGLFASTVALRLIGENWTQDRALRELAAHTGLTYKRGQANEWRVFGTYWGRTLTLETSLAAQDPYMRIVLSLNNPSNGYLSLRRRTFEHKAFDRQFTIESSPENLSNNLFASDSLCQRLLRVKLLRSVKMEGQELYFEGAVTENVRYLRSLFNLLSDLAEAVEAT